MQVSCPAPPEPSPGPGVSELLDIKDQCFKSLQEREQVIDNLRREISTLRQDIEYAKSDALDWQTRYHEKSCPED